MAFLWSPMYCLPPSNPPSIFSTFTPYNISSSYSPTSGAAWNSKYNIDTALQSKLGSVPITEKKTYSCPNCQYVTDRKNNLKRHVITMHDQCNKLLDCCDIIFPNKSVLRQHVISRHRNGYQCQICGRNFCRKALLKRHVTVHSGQKDFICNTCGYATSHKSNLERHRKIHQDSNSIYSEPYQLTEAEFDDSSSSNADNNKEENMLEDEEIDVTSLGPELASDNDVSSGYSSASPCPSSSSLSDNIPTTNSVLCYSTSDKDAYYTHKKYRYMLNNRLSCTYQGSNDVDNRCKPIQQSSSMTQMTTLVNRLCMTPYQCTHCHASFPNQMMLSEHCLTCKAGHRTWDHIKPLTC